jgi:F-type H+-transporting ATPase subunit gamma
MGLQILVQEGPADLGLEPPPADSRLAAIVMGTNQGMVGAFNRNLARHTVNTLDELQSDPARRLVVAVGELMRTELETLVGPPEETMPMPGSIEGVTNTVQELLFRIDRWEREDDVERVILVNNRPLGGSSYEPQVTGLLPYNEAWFAQLRDRSWPSRVVPTFFMDWRELFGYLTRAHIFVDLYRAVADSLAAENGSRLSSMQSAQENIKGRISNLQKQRQQIRQSEITERLLDVVAGFETLADEDEDKEENS